MWCGLVCVEESGTGISYNASALLSVHSFRIYSVSSLCFFLALPRLLYIFLVSLFSVFLFLSHAHFCHAGSRIHQACIIPPPISSLFSCSISWILAIASPSQQLYFAITLWLCSLCQESVADQGGCLKSICIKSEATCLWHFSPSWSSSCHLAHPSLFLRLVTLHC